MPVRQRAARSQQGTDISRREMHLHSERYASRRRTASVQLYHFAPPKHWAVMILA